MKKRSPMLAQIVRVALAILLGFGTYIATVVLLDAAVDWVDAQSSMRALLGLWWAAAQPFALGLFILAAEIAAWYLVLRSLIGSSRDRGHAA